jgi:hypothetical protein
MDELKDEEFDDEEHESRFEEIESRLDELTRSNETIAGSAVSGAYCVGGALATVLSWEANHAIGWAAIHGFLSWIYVIYFAVTRWAGVRVF